MMKLYYYVILLLLAAPLPVCGQKPTFLAPQLHKLLYADTVYNEAMAKKDTMLLAEAYYLYGKTYEATGDIEAAQGWFFKAFRILEPRGDSPALSRLYQRFGSNEYGAGKYKEAVRYYRLCIAMAERLGSPINMMRGYGGMAAIHVKDWSEGGAKPDLPAPRLDSALYYYTKVESAANRSGDSLQIAHANVVVGHFKWRHFKDPRSFLAKSKIALAIYTQKKRDVDRMELLTRLATYYMETHQYNAAWEAMKSAREIFDRNPFNDLNRRIFFDELYTKYYQAIGNWREAFAYSEKLRQWQVTKYSADQEAVFERLAKEYETEKKDALLKAKDKELTLRTRAYEAQQRFTLVSFLLLVIAVGMSIVFYRLYKKNRRISRQNELLVREQNHRVKNNLQAISSLLSLQSEELQDLKALGAIEESRLRVEAIAILHRKLYDGKQLAEVFLPDFLEELAESVLNAFGYTNVCLETQLDPMHLSADQALPLGLIVNELITDSCKYAFPYHLAPVLTIRGRPYGTKRQDYIRLLVADNGPGIPTSVTDNPGFGIKLINMEAKQLHAHYEFFTNEGTEFRMDFRSNYRESMLFEFV